MDLPLPPDFKEFLRLLNSAQIEYLVVGGYAVGYHGYPRPTGDLDIWVAALPGNAVKLVDALAKFGFADCAARRVDAVLDGVQVAIIGRDDLIANKLAAGRDRDRDDVSRLRAQ